MNRLFTPQYSNLLYETFRHLSHEDILYFCEVANIKSLCQTHPLISSLLSQKKIEQRTNSLIENNRNDLQKSLIQASYGGKVEIVDELLRRGADPSDGEALFRAVYKGHMSVVNRLLEVVDLQIRGRAMLMAITLGNLSMVDLLLDAGVDPSIQDNEALRLAERRGRQNIVNRLLDDPRVRGRDDRD